MIHIRSRIAMIDAIGFGYGESAVELDIPFMIYTHRRGRRCYVPPDLNIRLDPDNWLWDDIVIGLYK